MESRKRRGYLVMDMLLASLDRLVSKAITPPPPGGNATETKHGVRVRRVIFVTLLSSAHLGGMHDVV